MSAGANSSQGGWGRVETCFWSPPLCFVTLDARLSLCTCVRWLNCARCNNSTYHCTVCVLRGKYRSKGEHGTRGGGVGRPLNSRLKGATWMNHQHTGIGHLPPPEIAHGYWTGKKDLSSVFLSEHVAGILNVAKPWYGMNDTREKGGLPLFW